MTHMIHHHLCTHIRANKHTMTRMIHQHLCTHMRADKHTMTHMLHHHLSTHIRAGIVERYDGHMDGPLEQDLLHWVRWGRVFAHAVTVTCIVSMLSP